MDRSCFLCVPGKDLVYAKDDKFFAMLGLGPIVEGYSIIATRDHVPSMLDLSPEDAERLCEFTKLIRKRLRSHYGDVVIAEHGRVAPCEYRDKDGREAHCFHAHRLLFPLQGDLTDSLASHGLKVFEYPDFVEAQKNFAWNEEYLYYERQDGSCLIAAACKPLVRQFFRYKVAQHIGQPELASWKTYPRTEVVERARFHLGLGLCRE